MIVAIVGPTGVGKTKLSEVLAKKYNGIIVNCDAVQVYKELNIGSAKPKEEEKEDVPHYLFDIKSIKDDYNVKDYQKDLRNILDNNKDKNIFIVGGTGLYLCAGLYDYEFNEERENNYDNFSNEEIYNLCLKKDKNIDIHPNNRVRLIRFLNKEKITNNSNKLLYDVKFIGLSLDRKILYERINNRVDEMFREGLLEEVTDLKNIPSRVLNSAIGYKEVISFLNKELSKEEMIDLIKKNSRHYAKRQYTWFNNKMNVKWFSVSLENFDETIKNVCDYLGK